MSYKSILVHVEPTTASENRVRLAVDIAKKFEGRVVGLGAEAFTPPASDLAYVNADFDEQLRDDIHTRLRDAEARFKDATRLSGEKASWISAIDFPNRLMSLYARSADLIVANRSDFQSMSASVHPAGLVMESGLPVLLAPASKTEMDARYVVVGWKDSRECRRAVGDALPFLTHASVVHLVQVSETDDRDSCQKALSDVSHRLVRHGVEVRTAVLQKSKRSIATELQDAADRYSAELIVTGAYGHSRLREWALGGVTQELLERSSKFILFSH